MEGKVQEKEQAIKLRKQGKTYNEILKEVPVAKSTLSLWLREVGLSKEQKQTITDKKRAAQLRGAAARKKDRIDRSNLIINQAKSEVKSLSRRELLLIGAALYWAEGSKQKKYRPSVSADFANSDPEMIKIYMKWLRTILHVENEDITLVLHIHQNRLSELHKFQRFWLEVTDLPCSCLSKPVIKKHRPKTRRKNIHETYNGLVAIKLKSSTMLNRRIQGWIRGIVESS